MPPWARGLIELAGLAGTLGCIGKTLAWQARPTGLEPDEMDGHRDAVAGRRSSSPAGADVEAPIGTAAVTARRGRARSTGNTEPKRTRVDLGLPDLRFLDCTA